MTEQAGNLLADQTAVCSCGYSLRTSSSSQCDSRLQVQLGVELCQQARWS